MQQVQTVLSVPMKIANCNNIVKISQKRYSAAGINFLQPLSASAQQARKIDTSST